VGADTDPRRLQHAAFVQGGWGREWAEVIVTAKIDCQIAAARHDQRQGVQEWRPGRPSLACDLMEPLRVPVLDRWVVLLCNQQRIGPSDFVQEDGGVRLKPESFGPILYDWQQHWSQGGIDAELDGWLRRLEAWLRLGEQASGEVVEDEL
jgi:hypothetical protein